MKEKTRFCHRIQVNLFQDKDDILSHPPRYRQFDSLTTERTIYLISLHPLQIETEIVQNSNVVVDFEIREWIPKKTSVATESRSRFTVSIHRFVGSLTALVAGIYAVDGIYAVAGIYVVAGIYAFAGIFSVAGIHVGLLAMATYRSCFWKRHADVPIAGILDVVGVLAVADVPDVFDLTSVRDVSVVVGFSSDIFALAGVSAVAAVYSLMLLAYLLCRPPCCRVSALLKFCAFLFCFSIHTIAT